METAVTCLPSTLCFENFVKKMLEMPEIIKPHISIQTEFIQSQRLKKLKKLKKKLKKLTKNLHYTVYLTCPMLFKSVLVRFFIFTAAGFSKQVFPTGNTGFRVCILLADRHGD